MAQAVIHVMGCPRCPLYLRDSPGHIAQKRSGCGLLLRWVTRHRVNGVQPLSSGDTSKTWRIQDGRQSFLPERSDCCNQQPCAFGGHLKGRLSPDGQSLHGLAEPQVLCTHLCVGSQEVNVGMPRATAAALSCFSKQAKARVFPVWLWARWALAS